MWRARALARGRCERRSTIHETSDLRRRLCVEMLDYVRAAVVMTIHV
jgi:hypothetical protein